MRAILYITLMIAMSFSAYGQFLGGKGDGANSTSYTSTFSVYTGGGKDGSAVFAYKNDLNIFAGGNRSGYNSGSFDNGNLAFAGGKGDGYNEGSFILDFVWTGNVNASWIEPGNWSTNLVPDITRRVYIPQIFTNYPFITAGLWSIGEDPLGGDFTCRSITILDNAVVTMGANAELINLGPMNISGTLEVRNTSTNAIRNFNDGIITVKQGGSLIIGQ